MENRRSVIPPLNRPRLFGQPYHGLVVGGVLTLSNGKTVDVPWGWGDCYVLRVPGVAGQGVQMTPVEAAQEAAAGRQWLDYAMLVGRHRTYGGTITVGANAWLYAAPDGTLWRIECDRLDTTTIVPSYPVAPLRYGHYPAALDFAFKIQRFGVISPDEAETAPISTRTILQQPVGPEGGWQSDWFSEFPERTAAANRRFPGDGRQLQWMPINIDDINSKGSRVLFCVNRSIEQQMRSQPNGLGRAYPLAWIEVSVSGQGAADSIQISMSLVRMQLLGAFTDTDSFSQQWRGGFVPDISFVETHFVPELGGGLVQVGVGSTSNPRTTDDEIYCLASSTSHVEYQAGRCAGGYYDSSDVLCWVEAGPTISENSTTAGADISFTLYSASYQRNTHYEWEGGPWTLLAFIWWGLWQGQCSTRWTLDASCKIGPHPYQLPQLVIESDYAREAGKTLSSFWANGLVSAPAFEETAGGHVKMTSVFGEHETYDSGSSSGFMRSIETNGVSDGWSVSPSAAIPLLESGGGVRHGLQLRPIDNVYLVRVTNKVYALLAEMEELGFASGQKIIAVGTPHGWTTVNVSNNSDIGCAYNPVTGQLVTHLTQQVGWV